MVKLTLLDPQNEAELRRKIADGSQDPEDYRNLAELLFAAGRYEDAISSYEGALNLPLTNCQRAKVSMELGWIIYEMGRQAQALRAAWP